LHINHVIGIQITFNRICKTLFDSSDFGFMEQTSIYKFAYKAKKKKDLALNNDKKTTL